MPHVMDCTVWRHNCAKVIEIPLRSVCWYWEFACRCSPNIRYRWSPSSDNGREWCGVSLCSGLMWTECKDETNGMQWIHTTSSIIMKMIFGRWSTSSVSSLHNAVRQDSDNITVCKENEVPMISNTVSDGLKVTDEEWKCGEEKTSLLACDPSGQSIGIVW